jgi:hypothetical protein
MGIDWLQCLELQDDQVEVSNDVNGVDEEKPKVPFVKCIWQARHNSSDSKSMCVGGVDDAREVRTKGMWSFSKN